MENLLRSTWKPGKLAKINLVEFYLEKVTTTCLPGKGAEKFRQAIINVFTKKRRQAITPTFSMGDPSRQAGKET